MWYTGGMEKFSSSTESADGEITVAERHAYIRQLHEFIAKSQAMGANDSEVEAHRLLRQLQDVDVSLSKQYVQRIIGQLGSADDKSTNYH